MPTSWPRQPRLLPPRPSLLPCKPLCSSQVLQQLLGVAQVQWAEPALHLGMHAQRRASLRGVGSFGCLDRLSGFPGPLLTARLSRACQSSQ